MQPHIPYYALQKKNTTKNIPTLITSKIMIIFCIPHTPSNKKTNISRIPPTYIQLICIIPSHPKHNEKSLHHHNTHKKRYLNKPDMINTSAYFHQPISLFQTKAPLNNEQHKTIYLQTIQYIVTQLSHFYHPLTPPTAPSHPHGPPAYFFLRQASARNGALRRADCLSGASFCPLA